MRVGVISDTHGYLDDRALALLQGVDHLLHAGDIGDDGLIRELACLAPMTVVRGNVDRDGPAAEYPEEQVVELAGRRIYLTHQVKLPRRTDDPQLARFRDSGYDIVVFGHSHIAYQQWWERVLLFNPGAAGKRRFKVVPSVGILYLESDEVRAEVLEL